MLAALLNTEKVDTEAGLYNLFKTLFTLNKFQAALYVYSRYASLFPSGKNAADIKLSASRIEKKGIKLVPHFQLDGGGTVESAAVTTDDFSDGEMIFSEYEFGDAFYIVQDGKVELSKLISDNMKTLTVLTSQPMFGEKAVLDDTPRSASAIAKGTVKLMRFGRENFESTMARNPQIAMRLLKTFSTRIHSTKRQLRLLKLSNIHARVADVFLMLDEQSVVPLPPNAAFERSFDITPEAVGAWAGITPEQARTEISSFITEGRIRSMNNKIIVNNIDSLMLFVESIRKNSTK
jgi:CRP-like cAMP-binding protein